MKSPLIASLLLIIGLLQPCTGFAAATPPPPAQATPSLAGSYVGQWKGSKKLNGALELKLIQVGAAEWSAEMAFTYESTRVPTKFVSARVDGNKVDLTFTWEYEGTVTKTQLTGELRDSQLQGSYNVEGSKPGTWTVQRSLAGSYAGQWKSAENISGALELKLVQVGEAEWSAEMAFTYEGTRVPTKLKSARVEGNRVNLAFTWELEGIPVISEITGEFHDSQLQGRYQSDAPDEGTWTVRSI